MLLSYLRMLTDGNYRGEHFILYLIVKSLYCTHETNMICQLYSKLKKKKLYSKLNNMICQTILVKKLGPEEVLSELRPKKGAGSNRAIPSIEERRVSKGDESACENALRLISVWLISEAEWRWREASRGEWGHEGRALCDISQEMQEGLVNNFVL